MYKVLVTSILQLATKDGSACCNINAIVVEFDTIEEARFGIAAINNQTAGAFIQRATLLTQAKVITLKN